MGGRGSSKENNKEVSGSGWDQRVGCVEGSTSTNRAQERRDLLSSFQNSFARYRVGEGNRKNERGRSSRGVGGKGWDSTGVSGSG
jgi:hypothetical protein